MAELHRCPNCSFVFDQKMAVVAEQKGCRAFRPGDGVKIDAVFPNFRYSGWVEISKVFEDGERLEVLIPNSQAMPWPCLCPAHAFTIRTKDIVNLSI